MPTENQLLRDQIVAQALFLKEGVQSVDEFRRFVESALTQPTQPAEGGEQISPEMLAAGRKAIHDTHGASSAGIARCVYEAMRSVSLRTAQPASQASEDHQISLVDDLSNFIRTIDGRNQMGAGALAEKIVEWMNSR